MQYINNHYESDMTKIEQDIEETSHKSLRVHIIDILQIKVNMIPHYDWWIH